MRPAAEDFYAEIAASAAALARIVAGGDLARPVPTCPDWTLRQLATHVGRAHRWAAEIVSTRSPAFIPFREVPDGRFPDDPSAHAEWLAAGASRLADALRSAGDAPVWTHQGIAAASYWARRMAHETAVHRADAQLATGERPIVDAVIAADGIEEWLVLVTAPEPGEPDPRAALLADGRSLHLHATDAGLDPDGEWMIRAAPDGGLAVARRHGKGSTALRGSAGDMLLVLTRRLLPDDPAVEVIGDPDLLAGWLATTPF